MFVPRFDVLYAIALRAERGWPTSSPSEVADELCKPESTYVARALEAALADREVRVVGVDGAGEPRYQLAAAGIRAIAKGLHNPNPYSFP